MLDLLLNPQSGARTISDCARPAPRAILGIDIAMILGFRKTMLIKISCILNDTRKQRVYFLWIYWFSMLLIIIVIFQFSKKQWATT